MRGGRGAREQKVGGMCGALSGGRPYDPGQEGFLISRLLEDDWAVGGRGRPHVLFRRIASEEGIVNLIKGRFSSARRRLTLYAEELEKKKKL